MLFSPDLLNLRRNKNNNSETIKNRNNPHPWQFRSRSFYCVNRTQDHGHLWLYNQPIYCTKEIASLLVSGGPRVWSYATIPLISYCFGHWEWQPCVPSYHNPAFWGSTISAPEVHRTVEGFMFRVDNHSPASRLPGVGERIFLEWTSLSWSPAE